MEIIVKKYPRAVFTGESAFYYHALTDDIPDFYHLGFKDIEELITETKYFSRDIGKN